MAILQNSIIPVTAAPADDYTVDNSLKFDGSSSHLTRTFGSGDQTKWTYSLWVKRSALDTSAKPAMDLLSVYTGSGDSTSFQFQYGYKTTQADSIRLVLWTSRTTTTRVFRDLSAWIHLCLVMDTSQSTDRDKCKLYINGELNTGWAGESGKDDFHSAIASGGCIVNSATQHMIGAMDYSAGNYLNGYLADVYFLDGSAVAPEDNFIEKDSNGQWVPKEYTDDDYGTNGFHLDFSDSYDLGADAAGSNDFTATSLGSHDQMGDTPSAGKNYATLNPLAANSTATLKEGNLRHDTASSGYSSVWATHGMTSGKWYAEVYALSGAISMPGISTEDYTGISDNNIYVGEDAHSWGYYASDINGQYTYHNSSASAYATSSTTGDIIMIAFDADNGAIYFGINGTWYDGTTAASSWAEATAAYSSLSTSKTYFFTSGDGSSTSQYMIWNFGQDPTFNGNRSTTPATSEFAYTPPTDFKSLCTANLDDPGLNNAKSSEKAFAAKAYDDGAGAKTGLGFQPDLVWVKSRGSTSDHKLTDSVRDVGESLEANTSAAEETESSLVGVTSFDTN